MSRWFDLFNAAGNVLGPVARPATSRIEQRRHAGVLGRGALDPRAEAHARAASWGGDRRWFAGGTPPRVHNRITPLIDGHAFFTRLHQGLVEARHYVYVTGWCITPNVPLARESPEDLLHSRLLDVLSEVAGRVPVRILLWGGAPFILEPTRKTARDAQELFQQRATGDLICAVDETALPSHCHHQKAIVIDGQIAFVGGMDLTTYAGDRWDANQHELRASVNWHDVQALIEGEAVADVEQNFRQRWQEVTNDTLSPQRDPEFQSTWTTPAQIVRTIPAGRYEFSPRGEFGIRHAYIEAIRCAKRFVYLETQYLWAPEIMEALIFAMNTPRETPFRIVIVLPAKATSGKWNNDRQVEALREADGGRGIAEVYSLYSSGPCGGLEPFRHSPTYVHAKVAIIDDEWFTIGSDNLNERGLITDGEMNVVAIDPKLARDFRCALWSEHLALDQTDIAGADPVNVIDTTWRELAAVNAAVMEDGHAPLLSSVRRYVCDDRPGSGLLKRIQSLTLEH